jgi:hypothetical protein
MATMTAKSPIRVDVATANEHALKGQARPETLHQPRRQSVHFRADQSEPPLSPRTRRQRTNFSTASSVIGEEWVPQSVLSLGA